MEVLIMAKSFTYDYMTLRRQQPFIFKDFQDMGIDKEYFEKLENLVKDEEWFTMNTQERVKFLMENVSGCDEKFAKVLADFDLTSKQFIPTKKTETNWGPKLKDTQELNKVAVIIKEKFGKEPFKSRDLSAHINFLSSAQLPSRLRKLVESNALVDLGGSPKSYKLN
jgi:hypothetical protein